jgi:hypothetical protein
MLIVDVENKAMRLNVELFDIEIERRGRSWLSLLEINHNESLLYVEWGQRDKIQISFLFGLIKNK